MGRCVKLDCIDMEVGPMKDVNKVANYLVKFDEYSIYDVGKIKIRYVVMVSIGAGVPLGK